MDVAGGARPAIFEAAALGRAAEAALVALGVTAETAAAVAANLVASDLAGHPSHGLGMLPAYIHAVRDGRLAKDAALREVSRTGAVAVLDGGAGFGAVMGAAAVDRAMDLAADTAIAATFLGNSYHIGRIGAWGERCAARGFLSLHFVNVTGHRPLVAPFRGKVARLGTNPVCIALPRPGGAPLLLDYATSASALGKVREAYLAGRALPAGVLLDPAGEPTVDPRDMFPDLGGALTPSGGHKGYALAVMCEMLAGLAMGEVARAEVMHGERIINGMLTVVVDVRRVLGDEALGLSAALEGWLGEAGPEVEMPGDHETRSRARAGGRITLSAEGWRVLREAMVVAGAPESVLPLPGAAA